MLNTLQQGVLLCIPSFLRNNTDFELDREGQDKKINSDNTMLAGTIVVPLKFEHVDKETCSQGRMQIFKKIIETFVKVSPH